MNGELLMTWTEAGVVDFKVIPRNRLEGLRKPTETLVRIANNPDDIAPRTYEYVHKATPIFSVELQ
jgi:hypothetical protein